MFYKMDKNFYKPISWNRLDNNQKSHFIYPIPKKENEKKSSEGNFTNKKDIANKNFQKPYNVNISSEIIKEAINDTHRKKIVIAHQQLVDIVVEELVFNVVQKVYDQIRKKVVMKKPQIFFNYDGNEKFVNISKNTDISSDKESSRVKDTDDDDDDDEDEDYDNDDDDDDDDDEDEEEDNDNNDDDFSKDNNEVFDRKENNRHL